MDITDRQLTGIARAVHLTVNDREWTLEVVPRESLLDVLRQRLDLTARRGAATRAPGPPAPFTPAIASAFRHAARRRIRDLSIRPEMLS